MPSILTHSFFINDVYDKLPISKKAFLQNEINKLSFFSQGVDLLAQYSCIDKSKQRKINNFTDYFHKNKTSEFLINLINYIKYNYYSSNPEVMGLLYSTISHYVLDVNLNPYIYYKSNGGKTIKIENLIDKYLIRLKDKKVPYKYKHYIYHFQDITISKETIEVINFSFKETFKINNFSKTWLESYKMAKLFYKSKRFDPYGIKTLIYKLKDKVSKNQEISFLDLSYRNNEEFDFLNLDKNTWNYPTSKSKKSKKSFIELYTKSIDDTIKLINKIDDYIYENKKINLEKLLKSNSYITGVDISKSQKMKYFE